MQRQPAVKPLVEVLRAERVRPAHRPVAVMLDDRLGHRFVPEAGNAPIGPGEGMPPAGGNPRTTGGQIRRRMPAEMGRWARTGCRRGGTISGLSVLFRESDSPGSIRTQQYVRIDPESG